MLYIGIERNKKNIIYSLFVYFYINTLRIISNKRSSEVSSMTTNIEIIKKNWVFVWYHRRIFDSVFFNYARCSAALYGYICIKYRFFKMGILSIYGVWKDTPSIKPDKKVHLFHLNGLKCMDYLIIYASNVL